MGICGVALLSAFATTITASTNYRTLANLNTFLTSYAETATYQIQQEQGFSPCATATPSTYAFTLPPPSGGYSVAVSSITYWNGTSFSSTCTANPAQLIVATATAPSGVTGSLSFVVTEFGYAPAGVTPTISTAVLPPATQTAAYSQTLSASGGTPPLTWSITGGSLPGGLSLTSSTGKISGTVSSTASTQTFTVGVTDVNGTFYSRSLTIIVNPPPSIITTSLPNATVNQAYSQGLAATGGTSPLSWKASGLPAWLTLNANTGVLSGTPPAAGPSTFTVVATDANGVASTPRSLTITAS